VDALRRERAEPRELLADGLDHLPLTGDHFKRLGDVLAHLHDPVGTTAGATGRRLDHNTFTRQVVWKGFAHRLAPREGADGAGFVLCCGLFSRQRILGGGGFQFLKLQFQLINQPCATLGGDAVFVTPQLGNLQLQFLDHCLRAGCQCAGLRQLGFSSLRTGLCSLSRGGLRGKRGAQFGDLQGGI
jgi:hypothetical protein